MGIYRNTFSVLLLTIWPVLQVNLAIAKDFLPKKVKNAHNQQTATASWKQKEIIITIWNVSDLDSSAYLNLARENYNTIPINNSLESLDISDKNGLRSIFGHKLIDPANLHTPAKKKELDNLIDEAKKHRGLEATILLMNQGLINLKAMRNW